MSTKRRKNGSQTWCQTSLASWASIRGIGLHSGHPVELTLGPAAADSGLTFERVDLPGRPQVRVRPENIARSRQCTALEQAGVRVATVEHLLGALYGLGVDNAWIALDGEEVPILDGSAKPFVDLVGEAGVRPLDEPRSWLRLVRPIEVRQGDRWIRLEPAHGLSVCCTLDFDHPLIQVQRLRYSHRSERFVRELAPARTFGFLKDVRSLRRSGLARGGTLDNAVVIDAFSILNPGGLRFPDEFVRHKTLDLLGDLALLGLRLATRVTAYKSGHELHHQLLRRLVRHAGCCVRVQATADGGVQDLPADLSPLALPGLQSA